MGFNSKGGDSSSGYEGIEGLVAAGLLLMVGVSSGSIWLIASAILIMVGIIVFFCAIHWNSSTWTGKLVRGAVSLAMLVAVAIWMQWRNGGGR